jgi:hypothetical protein
MEKLGALWDKESSKGNVFKSGKINKDIRAGTKIIIFENSYKDKDSDPDYYIYLSEDKQGRGKERSGGNDAPRGRVGDDDSEVPF